MFKSLLCDVSVDSLILDIFIILAVVIAGALIVYFLWEAVSAATNKNKKEEVELKLDNKKETKSLQAFEEYSLDQQKEENNVPVEENLTEVDETKAEEEKVEAQEEISDEERAIAERRAYLEAKRQELIERMNADLQEQEEEEESEEPEQETEIETAQETEEVEPEEEKVEEETDKLEEERNALLTEKAKYQKMVRELEAAKRALQEQKPVVETRYETVVTNGVLSLDELKQKLAEAEERLRVTEKEFKQCKKEYTPLRRVWTTHEKDEKKLRRKEALVAKQKVILYGVNNYADIDEEKAKKLAEDLDLLDGLKLSVQHCEEVMKKNEERYPLLEKMYNVLSQRNDELKRDIAYYKEEIAKLEAEENE